MTTAQAAEHMKNAHAPTRSHMEGRNMRWLSCLWLVRAQSRLVRLPGGKSLLFRSQPVGLDVRIELTLTRQADRLKAAFKSILGRM